MTLLAGIATTIVACFPFVFTQLLSFVALFGILLSPVGAIVFVEHWLFPRLGFRQYWFSATGKSISWPALSAWVISVSIALGLWFSEALHEFFIAIPLWFVSAALYTVFASVAGARTAASAGGEEMATVNRTLPAAPSAQRPTWLRAVGLVALLTLLAQVVLPLWIMTGESTVYEARLPIYHFWLGAASVVHLATIAAWVVIGERNRE